MTWTWTRARCTSPEHKRKRAPCHTLWCWVTCTSWLKFWVASCHPCTCASLSDLTSLIIYFDLSFTILSLFFPFMHFEQHTELDNLIAMQNLRTSANKEVRTPTTSTPPSQVVSPTSWPSASSTTHRVPSHTLSRHRTRTWMTWHSARGKPRTSRLLRTRRRVMSVSQSGRRRLLCSIEQGNLWETEMSVSQLVLVSRETRTVLIASFSENTQAEKVVDRSVKPEERNSSNAQIRTLLDEQRQMIIAEYCEKIDQHELQAAQAKEERRILREESWRQQMDFREVHQQSLQEMEELRKFQSSTFDTLARRKLIEDQNTIWELSSRVTRTTKWSKLYERF